MTVKEIISQMVKAGNWYYWMWENKKISVKGWHILLVCVKRRVICWEKKTNKPKVRCATHVMRDCFNEANTFLENRNSSDLNESVDWYLFLEANRQWCEESVGGGRGKLAT